MQSNLTFACTYVWASPGHSKLMLCVFLRRGQYKAMCCSGSARVIPTHTFAVFPQGYSNHVSPSFQYLSVFSSFSYLTIFLFRLCLVCLCYPQFCLCATRLCFRPEISTYVTGRRVEIIATLYTLRIFLLEPPPPHHSLFPRRRRGRRRLRRCLRPAL